MKYGTKTDRQFMVRLSEEENDKIKKLLKELGITRREFLLTKYLEYAYWKNKYQNRLLREKRLSKSKATIRLGKRRLFGLLR
jgi:predicted nucleotide-binding protein (sugar kinase/HSP70/actin superfamily)